MNLVIMNGKLCTIPKITIIPTEWKNIYVCKFVMGIVDSVMDTAEPQRMLDDEDVDFIECVAFDQTAKMINDNFNKGSKIIVRGKLKNFVFRDSNMTPHCTDILLVELAECGETCPESLDLSIVSDLKLLDQCYQNICKKGFLCVDEDNYYNIASKSQALRDAVHETTK